MVVRRYRFFLKTKGACPIAFWGRARIIFVRVWKQPCEDELDQWQQEHMDNEEELHTLMEFV